MTDPAKSPGLLRPVLWLVLIISAAANAVTSSTGHTLVGIVFGVIALASAITLGVHHYRHRDSRVGA